MIRKNTWSPLADARELDKAGIPQSSPEAREDVQSVGRTDGIADAKASGEIWRKHKVHDMSEAVDVRREHMEGQGIRPLQQSKQRDSMAERRGLPHKSTLQECVFVGSNGHLSRFWDEQGRRNCREVLSGLRT